MPRPAGPPLGLRLNRTAKTVSRAFDDALAAADGSLPEWRILLALETRPTANQRSLAELVGIQGATLTHHLNAMEREGLLTRRRDPDNRRVHVVELTPAGEAAFRRMRAAAVAFDRRLRAGFADAELAVLDDLLARLDRNVADGARAGTQRTSPAPRDASAGALE